MGAPAPPPGMNAEAATAGPPARRASRWAAGLHRALVFGLYLVGGTLAAAAISHPGLVNERGGLISLVRGDAPPSRAAGGRRATRPGDELDSGDRLRRLCRDAPGADGRVLGL